MQQLIYDIGFHKGLDTAFYLAKGFKVVALEANPELVSLGKERFKKEIESGQLVLVPKALAPQGSKEVVFYTNPTKDDWGTILPNWNRSMSDNYQACRVEATDMQSLFEVYGIPYYLKIDIEGADALCLKQLMDGPERPAYISVELMTPNNIRTGDAPQALEILAYLHVLGYGNFKIVDQSQHHLVKPPNPAKEGTFVPASFSGESSGLFGKELDGPSYGFDTIARDYLNYFLDFFAPESPIKAKGFWQKKQGPKTQANGPFHKQGWFDVHAEYLSDS